MTEALAESCNPHVHSPPPYIVKVSLKWYKHTYASGWNKLLLHLPRNNPRWWELKLDERDWYYYLMTWRGRDNMPHLSFDSYKCQWSIVRKWCKLHYYGGSQIMHKEARENLKNLPGRFIMDDKLSGVFLPDREQEFYQR